MKSRRVHSPDDRGIGRRLGRWSVLAGAVAALAITPVAVSAAPSSTGALNLDAYRGKVVYLDFWASWCHPCEQSFPYMEQLKQLYGNDLAIVAVNVDHNRDRADAFLQRVHSDLTVVYDPKGELAARYAVKDMPTSILIDREGKVQFIHKGFFLGQIDDYNAQIVGLVHAK